jgi:hypothetical protein
MPKTLWNESARQELVDRLDKLTPDTKPLWGKFNASQMVAHIGSSMRMATGELPTKSKNLPIRFTPLKQIIVYWAPFPKGAPTAPELLSREVTDWNENILDVKSRIQAFATRQLNAQWPVHPAFGTLSPKAWGVLGYRHVDHHFRQFGV